MALPSALAGSWNPLRVTGTTLPANLLLLCKIIAVAALFQNHQRQLPDPFCPFLPFVDVWHGSETFKMVFKAVFVGSALMLLFNRSVRVSAFLLGSCFLFGVLISRAYYGNNKTFCGLALILAAISDPARPSLLLRLQYFLVYFGAGLNKLLLEDWRSGLFFDYWASTRLQHPGYHALAPLFPDLVLGQILCWATIVIEFFLAGAVLLPGWTQAVIWTNVLFQTSLLLFHGDTFNLFFFGMMAFNWAFIAWPGKFLVLYDGDCGFCQFSKRQVERVDFDFQYDWHPYQMGAGKVHGITDAAAQERLHLVDGNAIYAGYRAFKHMLLFHPGFWLAGTAVVALVPYGFWLRLTVLLILAPMLPIFDPIGEWVYLWVARNRHRLMPGATCDISRRNPIKDSRD